MAQALNFDIVTIGTVDVTKNGRTYQLRDDVPTEVLLRRFKIIDMLQAVGDAPTYEQMVDVIARQEAEVLDITTAIFQHTYTDLTQDDVAKLLTPRERQKVCATFFSPPSSESDEPPNATPTPAPSASPAPAAPLADMNVPTIASPSSSSLNSGA